MLRAILIIAGLAIMYTIDCYDRLGNHDNNLSNFIFIENEYKIGDETTTDYPKKVYQRNFKTPNYKFPRTDVSQIKVYKNLPLFSRLTRKKLSEREVDSLKLFFNSPDNFNWGETTWALSESDYIIRFYNKKNSEIGKVWVCINGCGMTFSKPFSPNMKYGGLSEIGYEKIQAILKF